MPQRRWTKDIIIENLKTWRANGVPVKLLWRQDPAMTSRATSMFGSWRAALAAAGIKSVRMTWTDEVIIERLRQTRGQGKPIPKEVLHAAVRRFGSIRKACGAAGVRCLTNSPPHLEWDKDKAIAAIRKRHEDGYSLRATAREDAALYAAGKRLFGTWTAARAAAGRCRALYDAVLHFHGSWRGGMAAAGINLANISRRRPQHLDRETMVLWLKERKTAGHGRRRGRRRLVQQPASLYFPCRFGWTAARR